MGTKTVIIDPVELSELYLSGFSALDLSVKYDCSQSTIVYNLRNAGVKIRAKKEKIPIDIKELVQFYNEGNSMLTTAKHFGCSLSTVRNRLIKANNGTRLRDKKSRIGRIKRSILTRLYMNRKYTIKECADFFGVSKETIRLRLIEYKIPRRTASYTGYSDDYFARVEELLELGKSKRLICRLIGCSQPTLDQYIKRKGL